MKTLSLIIKPVKNKMTSKKKSNMFPFEFEFSTLKGQQVIHTLKRKEGEFTSSSIADRVKLLEDPTNKKWHNTIAKWKNDIATGKIEKPKRKNRIKFKMVKVKQIDIDDDTQRPLDREWVAHIANPMNFEVEYMSPIQCIYDPDRDRFIAINAQHTVVMETAFAYHGIWDEFDGDFNELEVPVVYVESDSRALMRMGFRILNGENQKKIEPYIDHKILVLSKRVDGATEKEAVQAAAIQTINEEEGYEPISNIDKNLKNEPWAIRCISEMMKHYDSPDRWRFILRTHRKYFPNISMEVMECDLYGFMYDYFCNEMKVDVYSKQFEEDFLTPAMSIIQEFFVIPSTFGNDSAHTQIRWRAAKYNRSIDDKESKKIDAEGSFIYLLKLYRHFGGTQNLPAIVNNYDEKKPGDLLKHVDSQRTDLIKALKKYGKP